jgi:GAF domain-containing protein
MPDQPILLRVLSEFSAQLVRGYDIATVLHDLVDGVTEVLGVHGAGVSIADHTDPDRLAFVAATGDSVARVEQVQIDTADGPCHLAFRTGDLVLVDELDPTDTPWPKYTAAALEAGIVAVAGIPMRVDGARVGALNVYHDQAYRWTPDKIDAARVLADIATSYIVNADQLHDARRLADQLRHALDSRIVIEQAKGILAERHDLDPDAAFERLRRRARSTNTALREIARQVIDRQIDP